VRHSSGADKLRARAPRSRTSSRGDGRWVALSLSLSLSRSLSLALSVLLGWWAGESRVTIRNARSRGAAAYVRCDGACPTDPETHFRARYVRVRATVLVAEISRAGPARSSVRARARARTLNLTRKRRFSLSARQRDLCKDRGERDAGFSNFSPIIAPRPYDVSPRTPSPRLIRQKEELARGTFDTCHILLTMRNRLFTRTVK
jgi:hypothetical protein